MKIATISWIIYCYALLLYVNRLKLTPAKVLFLFSSPDQLLIRQHKLAPSKLALNWKMALELDKAFFPKADKLNLHQLATRCEPIALSNNHCIITIETPSRTFNIHYQHGIIDRLAELMAFDIAVSQPFYEEITNPQESCKMALCVSYTGDSHIELLVNTIRCTETHHILEKLQQQLIIQQPDFDYKLHGIIQLKLDGPRFAGSTKAKLNDKRADKLIQAMINKLLPALLSLG